MTKKEKEKLKLMLLIKKAIIEIIIENKNSNQHLSEILHNYTCYDISKDKYMTIDSKQKLKPFTIENLNEIKQGWFYKEAVDMFDNYKLEEVKKIKLQYITVFQNMLQK